MIPKPPPREPSLGFLYIPPYRVQGISIAGEATSVMVPELDICFDVGVCPRAMLATKYMAISHGHMDHIGSLAYYCSQRRFQGMGDATIVCDPRIAPAIRGMMNGFVDLERQKTPFELIELEPDKGQLEIKNNMFLQSFATDHNCPSVGYSIVEHRSKLKPEYTDLPQEKLTELKQRGIDITRVLQIPLVAYIGDTLPGPHLLRDDVRKAKIIITECTFFEKEHRSRAKAGQHMHVDDIAEWLRVCECEAMVISHVSRRTHLGFARDTLAKLVGQQLVEKVHFLMDSRTNRARYEKQVEKAEAEERQRNKMAAGAR
ncbi:MAG: hypothetical protein H6815_04015 [Phycisphaeraceae bacterium]|nr:hypothetical protein [Phycisphaerales bacterium]MCB9859596.1 hypothetical protein [Phycisphaeraceae bacterium]